jgi:hypothetical protein
VVYGEIFFFYWILPNRIFFQTWLDMKFHVKGTGIELIWKRLRLNIFIFERVEEIESTLFKFSMSNVFCFKQEYV